MIVSNWIKGAVKTGSCFSSLRREESSSLTCEAYFYEVEDFLDTKKMRSHKMGETFWKGSRMVKVDFVVLFRALVVSP